MKETWTNLSGSGFNFLAWKEGASLTVESEVFTTTESGMKVLPTPGCTLTIRDGRGNQQSFRLTNGACDDVAKVIIAAQAESDKAVRALNDADEFAGYTGRLAAEIVEGKRCIRCAAVLEPLNEYSAAMVDGEAKKVRCLACRACNESGSVVKQSTRDGVQLTGQSALGDHSND